ncbi:UBA/UBX 33.3 kDa protein [Zea mays]|uniref:UBA/UBX 33.3 kDa protein n=1 Tax=Zea mays TaxID=4577 RepID=B6TU29_MAIZE|nr:UBA/UBX 33.3 kDa protein [Zea mays]ACG40612.1 UBA/UBX 33.3 kDa protein [Zea mays]|eukprot:NP_001150837.1 UBA/UBX 33.3 kDa protein [Zea mays]
MAVPQVDKKMLGELEAMGFPTARSVRALHFSGNSNLESAVNWLLEHESDPDIDRLPLVPREISIECGDTSDEVRNDVEGMRDTVQEQKPKEHTETGRQNETSQLEREPNADGQEEEDRKRILALYKQKRDEEGRARGRIRSQLQEDQRERIRAAKDLMEAKRSLEENQRKRCVSFERASHLQLPRLLLEEKRWLCFGCRVMESRVADQEEEKRARERIRQRIADDKAERRRRLGLPQDDPRDPAATMTPAKVKPAGRAVVASEQLRDCLRTVKKNHRDDPAAVARAYQVLLKIVGNVAKNPGEEKFRRIRLSNPVFKDRVGSVRGGVEFLELCGFRRLSGIGYLVMPRDKVDVALLTAAGVEIASALENPYFGLLSK